MAVALSFPPTPVDLQRLESLAKVPTREMLAQEATQLGRMLQGQMGRSFRFLPRGGVFSPLLTYANDMDVQLFAKRPLTHDDWTALVKVASAQFISKPVSVRTSTTCGDEEEVEWADFNPRDMDHPILPYSTIVLTGVYQTRNGFRVPLDAVISSGDSNESADHRLEKIRQKCLEGNFAKVLQKVRAMLKNHKAIRGWLCDLVNSEIGKLRFITAQLKQTEDSRYYSSTLRVSGLIDVEVVEAWAKFTDDEVQARALPIIRELRGKVGSFLPGFYEATRSVEEF